MSNAIFKEHASLYSAARYSPRPIKPGRKMCPVKGWQKSDEEFAPAELERWPDKYDKHGIGLLLGTPFPDGTFLGALDIDRDDYVRVSAALLGNPPCGRKGAKGVAWFVRVRGELGVKKFDVKCADGTVVHIGELLCQKRLLVIPPTIHPDTNQPYRWVGKSLLEVDYTDLPIVEV